MTSSPGEPSSPSNGTEVTAADGSVTWTLPCSDPADQDMALNDKDKKDLVRVDAWRCGEPPTTTAAVFVAQLRKAPGTEDDAHRALRAAAQQMVRGDEPEHGAFQGHPGITNEITRNGKEYAYQGVSFGPYVVFFVAPADKLSAVTDTVRISA